MKYLTLEEKIKIENQGIERLPDALTKEERENITNLTDEEKNKFFFSVLLPRVKNNLVS